jgi:hypothetical protein
VPQVTYSTLYTEQMTEEQRHDWQQCQRGFIDAAKAAGASDITDTPQASAMAEGETLVRLISLLNEHHVPYAIVEQEQRADDDGMPA